MSNVLSVVTHGTIVLTSVSLALLVFDGTLFSYHPLFMSLGFLLLMPEGIMEAIGFRSLEGDPRVQAIRQHMWLQLAAVACCGLGFGSIFANKILHGKSHFKTNHGKVGLATTILSVLTPIAGAAGFKTLGIFDKLPRWLQQRIKWLHRNVGSITWSLSILAIELALTHPAVFKGTFTTMWQVGVVLIFAAVAVKLLRRAPKVKGDDPHAEDPSLPK